LVTREHRHVAVIPTREALIEIVDQFASFSNGTVVLLIEPGILTWDDLALVRSINDAAFEHAVSLRSVTPDSIAGSLLEAVGITTTTVGGQVHAPVPTAAF